MGFEVNEISKNSKGGTELMRMGLEERLPAELLETSRLFVQEFEISKMIRFVFTGYMTYQKILRRIT